MFPPLSNRRLPKVKKILSKVGSGFLGLFYPNLCPVCGGKLVDGEKAICLPCRWSIPLTGFVHESFNPVFTHLREDIPGLRQASALFFFHHDSDYRQAIHQLKYNGRRDLAVAFGAWLGRELKESGFYDDVSLLVPVPLHWSKRFKRGYNQAEEICRGMSRSMGIEMDFRSLKRVRRTKTQALYKSRDDRHRNVKDAFTVRPKQVPKLTGRHILLVDDVLTTGATIKACAEALRRVLSDEDLRISVVTLAAVRSMFRV